MSQTRRQLLKGGALAALGGGFLARLDKVAAMQKTAVADASRFSARHPEPAKRCCSDPQPGEEGPTSGRRATIAYALRMESQHGQALQSAAGRAQGRGVSRSRSVEHYLL